MIVVCKDKYGLPVFCCVGWTVESDTNAIEAMAFARGFELAIVLCGHNKFIRGKTDSLDIMNRIDSRIVNITMELALKIIQGEYSQSNKLLVISVAQSFFKGQ